MLMTFILVISAPDLIILSREDKHKPLVMYCGVHTSQSGNHWAQ